MFDLLRILFFSVFVLLLSSCGDDKVSAGKDKSKPKLPETLTSYLGKDIGSNAPYAFVAVKDDLAVLYQNRDRFVFRKNGVDTIVAEKQKPAGHFWLHFDGAKIYALWWRKFNEKAGKQLFISVSDDMGKTFSIPYILNSGSGVLPTIGIASDDDNIIVTYHDERENVFHVYANLSTDGGKTWLENDIRIDQNSIEEMLNKNKQKQKLTASISPNSFLVDNKMIIVWLEIKLTGGSGGISLKSKSYDLTSKSWSVSKTIYSNLKQSGAEYKAYLSGDNLITLVEIENKGLLAFVSSDAGETWEDIGSNYSNLSMKNKLGVSFINLVTDINGGKAYVITTHEEQKKKTSISLSVISLLEKKWIGNPQELDKNKDHKLTRSFNPKAVSLEDGTLISAWDDYRHILSTVYVDVKKPNNGTWLPKPRPLTAPGYYNVNLEKLVAGKTKAWVITKRGEIRANSLVSVLYVQEIKKEKSGNIEITNLPDEPILLSEENLKKRLKKRVIEFWKLRQEGNWMATWEYFDPLYRLKFGKKNWLSTQGKLTFGEFKLKNIKIENDIFGMSQGTVSISMNLLGAEEGVLEASPPVVKNADSRWGWFYDDWYMMPNPFFMKVHDY